MVSSIEFDHYEEIERLKRERAERRRKWRAAHPSSEEKLLQQASELANVPVIRLDDIPEIIVYVAGGSVFHTRTCPTFVMFVPPEAFDKCKKLAPLAYVAGYYPCKRCNPLGVRYRRHAREYDNCIIPSIFPSQPVREAMSAIAMVEYALGDDDQ